MSVTSKLKLLTSQLSRASSSSKPTNNNDALKLDDATASELKTAKSKLDAERMQLDDEKRQLRIAQAQLKDAISKFESTQLEVATSVNTTSSVTSLKEENQTATESLTKEILGNGNPIVHFDMTLHGEPHGRITFELYADTHPRLAEIFRALCAGEKVLPGTDRLVGYKGTEIMYVGNGQIMSGGNVRVKNRAEFDSIYGNISRSEISIRKSTGNGDLFLDIGYDEQQQKKTHSFIITGSNSDEYADLLYPYLAVIGRVVEGIDVVDNPKNYGIPEGHLDEGTFVISDCGQLS